MSGDIERRMLIGSALLKAERGIALDDDERDALHALIDASGSPADMLRAAGLAHDTRGNLPDPDSAAAQAREVRAAIIEHAAQGIGAVKAAGVIAADRREFPDALACWRGANTDRKPLSAARITAIWKANTTPQDRELVAHTARIHRRKK